MYKFGLAIAVVVPSVAMAALPSKPLTTANKTEIAIAVKEKLKDPDSAQFRWPAVRDWGLYCGWVNAKNSFGGYTGFQPFMVMGGVGDGPKADGKFLIMGVDLANGDNQSVVYKMCGDAGFDLSGPPAP